MPTGFVGHGAPTLALQPERAAEMRAWGAALPRPVAWLVVSAHWEQAPLTAGALEAPTTVHDFFGFPAPLYDVRYPAPGAPALAERVAELAGPLRRSARGLDHGVWVPLLHLAPAADVPVLQLSLPRDLDPTGLFALGQRLAPLREEGVLVLGSGALVHNLGALDWSERQPPPEWARAFDGWLEEVLLRGDQAALLRYAEAPGFARAHPTDEHLRPLLVAAGAAGWGPGTPVTFPVRGFEYGSLSRRSVQFGP